MVSTFTHTTLRCSHRFATHIATNSIRLRYFSRAGYILYRYHIAQRSLFDCQLHSRLRHNRFNPDTRHGAAEIQTAMRTLVFHMVEFCELALVNVDGITKRTRHNLLHQWFLVATTKSLTGTIATSSLHTMHTMLPRHHCCSTWCRRQAFFDCCFPLNLGQSRFMCPASPQR